MADIHADIDLGKSLGVTGTPSVFINGRKIPGFRAQTRPEPSSSTSPPRPDRD